MEGTLDFPHQPVAKEDILRDDRKFLVFFYKFHINGGRPLPIANCSSFASVIMAGDIMTFS